MSGMDSCQAQQYIQLRRLNVDGLSLYLSSTVLFLELSHQYDISTARQDLDILRFPYLRTIYVPRHFLVLLFLLSRGLAFLSPSLLQGHLYYVAHISCILLSLGIAELLSIRFSSLKVSQRLTGNVVAGFLLALPPVVFR
jgi:hypothetical protein